MEEIVEEQPNDISDPPSTDNAHANSDSTSQSDSLDSQLAKLLASYDSLGKKLKTLDTITPNHTQIFVHEDSQPRNAYSSAQYSPHPSESMIALKDLPLLQRKEFKIQGGGKLVTILLI